MEAAPGEPGPQLARARNLYDQRAWTDARQAFLRADEKSPLGAEDLDRFAVASYLAGRDDDYLAALARAHQAYLKAGAFPQADSEFDRCIKRRGEAMSLFVDEDPSFGHFPSVYYYQGRVREGLGNAGSTESYKAYLAFRGQSKEDPLALKVRSQVGQ